MELNERKYINNTKELPGFSGGYLSYNSQGVTVNGKNESSSPGFFGAIGNAIGTAGKAVGKGVSEAFKFAGEDNKMFGTNANAIATGAMGAIDMIGSIGANSRYEKTADDLLRDAGTSQSNIGGVGYTVQNGVDIAQMEAEEHALNKANTIGMLSKGASTGAAVGSLFGPVGGAIGGAVGAVGGLLGGLFGSGKRHAAMRRALHLADIKRINLNDFNRSGALTTVLLNNLALTEGNQEDLALYGAADGKLPGFMNGFVPNCRLSNGEHVILRDPIGNPIADIPVGHGRDNKDTVKAFIPNNASVITNKYGASEYLEKTGDINGAEYLTAMNILNKKYKNGKLPGFVNGLEAINAIGNLGLAGLNWLDYNNKKNKPVKNSYTNVNNSREADALYGMSLLRQNAYPIIPQIYENTAKGMNAIENAGGLGGGQRNLSRLAAIENANKTIANLLSDNQLQNNKLRMAYLDAAANMGDKDAARQQQAMLWDLDYYSRAHGAREKMADKRRADALTFFLSYLKGVNDIHMYRQMKDMWDKEYKASHPEADASLSINSPKVQLDPMNLIGKANFAGAKSYATNPLAGSVEAGRPLPEFTAITPKRKKELEEWAKLPKRKVMLPWEYNSRADYATTYPPFFGGFADYSYGSLDNIKLRK